MRPSRQAAKKREQQNNHQDEQKHRRSPCGLAKSGSLGTLNGYCFIWPNYEYAAKPAIEQSL
jgi:hypothetical protein